MPAATRPTSRAVDRFLSGVEWAGNILPHPAVIFVLLAVSTVVASAIARAVGLSAVHPGTGETVVPFSLLSTEGIHRILSDAVKNFTELRAARHGAGIDDRGSASRRRAG